MTVPVDLRISSYVTNGVVVAFPTVWRFLLNAHVVVKYTPSGGVETVLTEGVHYTLVGAGLDAGGTVTTIGASSPRAAGALRIERTVPLTQLVDLRAQGSFAPAVHMTMMDQLAMADQQLEDRVSALESAGAPGSVVAGNGLTFASTTLHVGAGAGIQSNADDIAVIYGVVGETVQVSKTGAAAGALNKAARIDHSHNVLTGNPLALAVGAAMAPGAGPGLALNDHVHGVPIGGVPVVVDGAAGAPGATGLFSDAGHRHQVSIGGTATALTDAASAGGGAATLSASDHTHGHGDRGGGTLHAAAVSGGANGFMTGIDKAALDLLTGPRSYVQVDNNVAQSIPHATATTIKYALEKFDTLGEYDPATGIFTATKAGYYLVSASLQINLTAADAANVDFWIEGPAFAVQHSGQAGIRDNMATPRATGLFLLAVGETIRVKCYQTNTPAVARSLTSNQTVNCLTIARML